MALDPKKDLIPTGWWTAKLFFLEDGNTIGEMMLLHSLGSNVYIGPYDKCHIRVPYSKSNLKFFIRLIPYVTALDTKPVWIVQSVQREITYYICDGNGHRQIALQPGMKYLLNDGQILQTDISNVSLKYMIYFSKYCYK